MFPTAKGEWLFIEESLKLKYEGKMLRMMDSVKLVDTAVVYLRTSLAEPIHGRAAFL